LCPPAAASVAEISKLGRCLAVRGRLEGVLYAGPTTGGCRANLGWPLGDDAWWLSAPSPLAQRRRRAAATVSLPARGTEARWSGCGRGFPARHEWLAAAGLPLLGCRCWVGGGRLTLLGWRRWAFRVVQVGGLGFAGRLGGVLCVAVRCWALLGVVGGRGQAVPGVPAAGRGWLCAGGRRPWALWLLLGARGAGWVRVGRPWCPGRPVRLGATGVLGALGALGALGGLAGLGLYGGGAALGAARLYNQSTEAPRPASTLRRASPGVGVTAGHFPASMFQLLLPGSGGVHCRRSPGFPVCANPPGAILFRLLRVLPTPLSVVTLAPSLSWVALVAVARGARRTAGRDKQDRQHPRPIHGGAQAHLRRGDARRRRGGARGRRQRWGQCARVRRPGPCCPGPSTAVGAPSRSRSCCCRRRHCRGRARSRCWRHCWRSHWRQCRHLSRKCQR